MATLAETSPGERLGYDVVAKVISNLYGRMLRDPRAWYYWKGHSSERQAAERRDFTERVCASLGGPMASQAGAFQAAHVPLGLCAVEWWIFVELAAEAVDQSGLPQDVGESLFFGLSRSKAAISTDAATSSAPLGFATPPRLLSQREREVLRLVAMGKNNSEIAAELSISVNTVTRHVTNIFAKTNTNNRVQAAVYAARSRIV